MLRRILSAWQKAAVFTTLVTFSVNANAATLAQTLSSPQDSVQIAPEVTPDNDPEEKELHIPQKPTAPPSLLQIAPSNPFHCKRAFVYQGKTLECDSNVRRDGENLRPIIKDVPTAVEELDNYQLTKRDLKTSAYVASLGLGIVLLGYLLNRPPFEENAITTGGYFVIGGIATALVGSSYAIGEIRTDPRNRPDYLRQLAYVGAASLGLAILGFVLNDPPFNGGAKLGGYIALGGLSLGLASFGYHLGQQSANENHLNYAADEFNHAHPDRPIELKFTTYF